MRAALAALLIMTLIVAGQVSAGQWLRSAQSPVPASAASAAAAPMENLTHSPAPFVANAGQVQRSVAFVLDSPAVKAGFLEHGVAWRLSGEHGSHVIRQEFVGGRAAPPSGVGALPTRYSWFKGDPADWITGARAYTGVRYSEVWPGIDVVYVNSAEGVKYRFVVAPGADPSQIAMRYRGAQVSLTTGGNLEVGTPVRAFVDPAPTTYQGIASGRQVVESSFRLRGNIVSVEVGHFDPSKTLVIDPVVPIYSGFIGGSGGEYFGRVAIDASGAAYVTGRTSSTQGTFPVAVGPDLTHNTANDAFVAKVNAEGTGFVYVGYIGGTESDVGMDIEVDSSGAAYVTGTTGSTQASFPVKGNGDVTFNGGDDAFVAKVNPSGGSLAYAGYIGGSSDDSGKGIAVDALGAAYVVGETESTQASFPETGGPDLTHGGGGDGFVVKVSATGNVVNYGSYIGGSARDYVAGVAVDAQGAAYVSGYSQSTEATFPATVGPDLTSSGSDAFVAKIVPSGASFAYLGFIGGDGQDYADGIAVDTSGAAYVAGTTRSSEATFPVSVGPDLTFAGGPDFGADAFIAKVAPSGESLQYAGYLGGGNAYDYPQDVAVDSLGAAYVVGWTGGGFPVLDGPSGESGGGFSDGWVAKVAPGGASFAFSGYVGGAGNDEAWGVAVDTAGAAYVTGFTSSSEDTFPVTIGPDPTHNGGVNDGKLLPDIFVMKLVQTLARLDSGPEGKVASGSAQFGFSSLAPSATFECKLDSGSYAPCTSPKDYDGLSEGSHTFSVRGLSGGGQPDVVPATRTWTVDTVAPNTIIDSGPIGTSGHSPTFAFSSTETGSTFECSLDAAPYGVCTSPLTMDHLADGSHTFAVRATDEVDNTDATPASRTWTVDGTEPATSIDTGPAAAVKATFASFTFSSGDPAATFQCKLDGGNFAICSSPKNYTNLGEGSHTLAVKAINALGNEDATPATWDWVVDTASPQTSITSGPSGPTSSTSANLAFTSDEEGATFQCRLDGGIYAACSSPVNLSSLAEGSSHTFYVYATDAAGNADGTPATRSWSVDTMPPNTTLDAHPGASSGIQVSFAFSSNDPQATFECRLDAAAWGACASPHDLDVGDGNHTFDVRAVDLAGNPDASPATWTWDADGTAPDTGLDSGPSGAVMVLDASFTFQSDDPTAVFECRLDGASWGTCTSPKGYTNLGFGSHTFDVRARDLSGNADPSPASRTWNIYNPVDVLIGGGSASAPVVFGPRASDGFVGGDLYNDTGSGQIKTLRVSRGRAAVFTIRVQNDGISADSFTIKGGRSSRGFKVSYFLGANNVTQQVLDGTLETLPLEATGYSDLKLKVKIGASGPTSKVVAVTATSVTHDTSDDTVKGVVKVKT